MTLDEAIIRLKEKAKEYERKLKMYKGINKDKPLFREEENACKLCVEEHRQLAEWLKDYKRLKEQESCEDCISRKAAIVQLSYNKIGNDDYEMIIQDDINTIKALPPVILKSKTSWIPVSEKLPEKNVEVLATTESGYITIAEWFEYDHWFIHEGSSNAHTDELTAWMPLPPSYQEEEGSEA